MYLVKVAKDQTMRLGLLLGLLLTSLLTHTDRVLRSLRKEL
jgi:hypothetical protein